MKKVIVAAVALSALSHGAAFALLGGPALETDHPFYPGIGKYRDAKAIIEAAYEEHARVTGVKPTNNRDRSIAIWRWLMQHLYHGTSRPMEFLNNVDQADEEGAGVYDSIKFINCYQFAICYASSCAISGLMEEAGYTARGRGVSGHTVHECFYDGDWHYLDHDMAGICFEADHTTIASVDEINRNRDLINWDYRSTYNIPQFPWDGGPGSGTMKGAFTKSPQSLYKYNDHGIAVHPSTLVLRHGERFARYFNYDRAPWGNNFHWTGLKANAGHDANGPNRNLTYVNDPPADGKNNGVPSKPYVDDGLARYGNGLFEYEPDLSESVFLDEAYEKSDVECGGSPKLKASGAEGKVVLRHWTPYVICGDPETHDPWAKVGDAVIVSGAAVGDGVKVAVSVNNGLNWEERAVSGEFSEDFSMLCRARYQYLLRFTMPKDAGLDKLHVRTVTMCAPSMMPHLHDGGNTVKYSASSLAIAFADPDLKTAEGFNASFHEIKGFRFDGGNVNNRAVATDNNSAWLTMKPDPKGPVKRVAVYAFIGTRSPPRDGCNVAFQYSTDGKNFLDIKKKTLATDADHWRHWLAGITDLPEPADEVYLRFYVEPHGTPVRVCRVGGYAWHDAGQPPAVAITHVWKEGGTLRRHGEKIDAGEQEKTYKISCGSNVQNVSVAFEVPQKPEKAASRPDRGRTGRSTSVDRPEASGPSARGLLAMARNYLRGGMNDKGREYLERILNEFPKSREADEARKLLKMLDQMEGR